MTLARRTSLKAQPRSKGNRAERAVIDIVRAYGWAGARRNWQSGGQGGGDIIGGPADVHLEVKWRERCCIWDWIHQALAESRPTDIPVVVLRDNKHPAWWAVAPKDELDALEQLDPRMNFTVVRNQEKTFLWKWIDMAVKGAATVKLIDGTPVAGVGASVEFSRAGEGWWKAVPFDVLLNLLKLREAA